MAFWPVKMHMGKGGEGKGLRCRIRVATTFWRLNRCLMAKAGRFWGASCSCFRGELTVRRGTLMSPMRPHLRSRRGGGQRRRASCWRRSNGAGRRLRCSWRSGWAWSSWPARLGDVLGVPSEEKAIFGDDITMEDDDEVIRRSCTPGGSADGRGGPHAVMDKERDDLRKALYVLL